MTSYLRAAAYSFDLDMVKSPPSIAASHDTPSPSSTITESNSSLLAVSTRKPRTQRKRPNQTYDEAAALLSTAYPNIFSSKKKTPWNPQFLGVKSPLGNYDEASHLLLPFDSIEDTGFLFNPTIQTKPDHFFEHKEVNSGGEVDSSEVNRFEFFDHFDAESILDEEVEEGINSFMGNVEFNDGEKNRENGESGSSGRNYNIVGQLRETMTNFHSGLGLRSALRNSHDGNWWKFPTVEFEQISPRIQTTTTAAVDDVQSIKTIATVGDKKKKKKKKKQKINLPRVESKSCETSNLKPVQRVSPFLKLDYDGVLEAWSDKDSPFSDDVHARLGEIDLFGESETREAIVLRYKKKRRNRLFSRKIGSDSIKFANSNADQRPRVKGRFVRRRVETT